MVPAVSVIIPTYNRAALLAEAVATASAQIFRDFEILVVDDGSTDETPATLAHCQGAKVLRHPARRIASRHKKLLESHLADVLSAAGQKDAESAARKIWIISEGAMALVLIHGDASYYDEALNATLRVVSD